MGKPIDAEYVAAFAAEQSNKPLMEACFIRVYHMKDGTKIEMDSSPYLTYEEAHAKLWHFHPTHEQGVDDMANVDYVTIEKRFSPTPYWKG